MIYPMKPRTCRACGREFQPRSGTQVFCSEECREASRKKSRERYARSHSQAKRPYELKRMKVDRYLPIRQIPRDL